VEESAPGPALNSGSWPCSPGDPVYPISEAPSPGRGVRSYRSRRILRARPRPLPAP